MKYVVHSDVYYPTITPKYKYIDSAGLAQNFSDNTIYSFGDRPVILQTGANVQDDKDLNSVEIFVKPFSGTYGSMNKWIYEPANTPGLVYTTTGRGRTIYRKDTETEIATAADEGVYPLKNAVSLDFFKYRWDTKANIAGTGPAFANSEARWPDGTYTVKMDAMDIIGYPDDSSPTEEQKILNNFRPLLERVEIKNADGETKYLHTWNLNGTTLERSGPAPNEALGAGAYTINFRFSEPVVSPTAPIDTLGGLTLTSADPAGNQKNFSANFSVGEGFPIQDGLRTMTVNANDSAGTALLALASAKTTINNSEITRNNSSGFFPENAGPELVDFTIGRPALRIDNFEITNLPVNIPQGVQITFDILASSQPGVTLDIFIRETNQIIKTQGLMKHLASFQSIDGVDYFYYSPEIYTWVSKSEILYETHVLDPGLLPYMASFRTDWHGEVVGKPLSTDATFYTLVMRVRDGDGNTAESSCGFAVQTDTTPPTISWEVFNQYMPPSTVIVTGSNTLETAPWFTGNYINVTVNDYGVGTGTFSVLSPEGTVLFSREFQNGQNVLGSRLALPADATGYMATAVDVLGNATTAYFHVARFFPEVTVSTIAINKSTGGYSLTVSGDATDAPAGLAGPVIHGVRNALIDGAPAARAVPGVWPPGPASESFSFDFPYPETEPDASFHVYNSAGLLGATDMNTLRNYVQTISLSAITDIGTTGLPLKIFDKMHYKVEPFQMPALPAGCTYLDAPSGMHVQIKMEPRTPDSYEIADLNNWLSAFSGIALIENYSLQAPGVLADVYTPGVEETVSFDSVLPRYVRFSLVSYPNTNTVRSRCFYDVNGNGQEDPGEVNIYPAGPFQYTANGDVTIKSSLMSPPLKPDNTHWVPSGINVAITSGNMELTFAEVSAGGRISIGRAASYPVISGWRVDPQNTYDFSGAQITGDVTVKMRLGNLTETQTASAKIYHFNETTQAWEDITTGREANAVIGTAASLSPFVVMVPVDDRNAPKTSLAFRQGGAAVVGGNLYISSAAYVNLYADDFAIQGDISGVGAVYVLVNVAPTAECLTVPFDTQAPQGTCANRNYAAPFRLNEGIHSLYYAAADKAGNLEVFKSTVIYVDGTPPWTQLTAGTMTIENGATAYITAGDSITLTAVDLVSNGVASGKKWTAYFVDIPPDSCGELGPVDPATPPGSCRNYLYIEPFLLLMGTHTVYYSATDNVGNKAAVKSANFAVSGDTIAPVTSITFGEPKYATAISTYITGNTSSTLTASDNFSGVKLTEYRVDSGSWTLYENPFTLAQAYGIPETPAIPAGCAGYWSFDEEGGLTAADSCGTNNGVLLNGPVRTTAGKVNNALIFNGVNDYVSVPDSPSLNFASSDFTLSMWMKAQAQQVYYTTMLSKSTGWGSGGYNMSTDGNGWLRARVECGNSGDNTFPGPYNLRDDAWHYVAMTFERGITTMKGYVDGEPVGAININCPNAAAGNGLPLIIGAHADMSEYFNGLLDEIAVYGRALTDEEIKQRYSGVPAVKEGQYVISYRSTDKADNREAVKEQPVLVDETPPETMFSLLGPQVYADPSPGHELPPGTTGYGIPGSTSPYVPPGYRLVYSANPGHYALASLAAAKPAGKWLNFITGQTELVFTAADAWSGVKETRYALNGALPSALYSPPVRISGEDGLYALRYQSRDQLGHWETVKSSQVYLDNTAPASRLEMRQGKWESGNVVYVSSSAQFIIAADDAGGCGVKEISYSIDNSPFAPYVLPFALAGFPEGGHAISYYSEDLLGNREAVKTLAVFLDGTAPVTQAEIGDPKLELNGKIYVTSRTAIALLGADKLSGVNTTLWKLDEKGWFGYKKPFALSEPVAAPVPEGRVAYWNFDEGSGNAAYDQSGNNNNGTIYGASWTEGKIGGALSFDGVNDIVQIPSAASLNFGSKNFTLYTWVKQPISATGYDIIYKSTYWGSGGYAIQLFGGILRARVECGSSGDFNIPNSPDLRDDKWHQIAITVERAPPILIRGYVDGANIGDYSLNCPDAAADNAIPLQFGRDAANQDPSFLGLIDEAAIYDRALTPEEINQQYLGGITLGPVEGGHLLSYYSVDNVGNKEPAARVALVVDSSGPAAITDLAAVARTTHSVTIAWSAPEDIGALGKLGKYAIGCSTAQEGLSLEQALTIIPAGPEETSGSPKAHTIGNLAEGTAYYLAVWSMDGLGNPSGISNAVSTRTYHFETSPDGLMGVTSPETEISVALASTETAKPAYAALAQGGLAMAVSAFYDLQPDNILVEPPAELRFIFNPVDVDTATLAIYRFDGVSWSSASVSGQKIEYLAGGSAVITGWINRTSLYTALYRKDRMAPRTELTARGYKAGEAEYVRKDTIFALTSIDDLAAANDGIGLGVKRQRVEVRSQMSEVRELTFVNSEPKPGATFASTFTLAGEADGFYSLSYNAEDVLGSAEQVKTGAFALDNTPPVSAISAGSPRFTAFGLTVITPDTPITLSAGDPAVNDTASGLKDIQYAIEALGDGSAGEPAAYTEPVRIASQGVFIIRYWSRDNVNNGEAPKEMRLAVTTLQQDALIAAGGLKMTGAAEITGKVESNGVAALSGDTRIAGDVAAGTITLAGNAQITGRRTAGVTPVNPVPIELLDITQAVGSSNNNDLLAAKYLINGRLTASGKAVITLSAGTYYLKGIKLTGGSSIVLAGPVAMLVEGEISLSGGSLLNAGGAASKLNIFVSTDSTLDFTGGGSLTAYLYAPYSDLKLSGNAVLAGHYFVKSGTLSGTGNLIQSGETPPLITASLPDGGKKGVSAIGGFSVLSAGPDPAFKPGEVYVFPDPAKGGAAPTFHIECGVADKVAIKIYTVSGRLAHETTLTGLPQIIDDGNGSEYAYEYAWNEHIPSGIYYYYIEAEKAGKDLKKAGKFAVVR